METIHQILIDSVSGGFWKFIGYYLIILAILSVFAKLITFAINRPLRHYTLRKLGYPPIHCDADGDFKEESK